MGAAAVPLLVASSVVAAGSSIMQGRQQKAFADYQAKQAEADAAAEKGAAQVRAERIRRMTKQARASARAGYAAGGVNVGEGTPLLIDADIAKRGEEDAILGIFDANDAAARLRAQAAGLRMQGNQAQRAGYIGAFSSSLAAGSQMSGWRGVNTSSSGTGSAVVDANGARAY